MQWWELTITVGDVYADYTAAEDAYLRSLDQGGAVAVRWLHPLQAVQAVSCYRALLLPLMARARRWPTAQISLARRAYPAPPCATTWRQLYGHPPAPARRVC